MSTPTRLGTRPATPNQQNWRSFAACREVDPELFYPVGDSMGARMQAADAKRVCASCPAAKWCLQWALETREDIGVWGGLTEQERFRLHRRRGHIQWGRPRNVADRMWEERRDDLEELVGQGLLASQIAGRLGTNVQTVNRLLDRLAEVTMEGAMSA